MGVVLADLLVRDDVLAAEEVEEAVVRALLDAVEEVEQDGLAELLLGLDGWGSCEFYRAFLRRRGRWR